MDVKRPTLVKRHARLGRPVRTHVRWVLPSRRQMAHLIRTGEMFDEGGFMASEWGPGRLVWKTPEEALGGSHGPVTEEQMQHQIEGMGYGKTGDIETYQTEVIDDLVARIRNGLPIDPIGQTFDSRGEVLFNGLHRIVAAKIAGSKVPVVVYKAVRGPHALKNGRIVEARDQFYQGPRRAGNR